MSAILSVSNKILSLRGRMLITDEAGELRYEAQGAFALLSPTWRLRKGADEIATLRRKILTLRPTWVIDGSLGEFTVHRKIFSWTRRYWVVGGPFDGAGVKGNLLDLKFEVTYRDAVLAQAQGRIVSLRDTHDVQVIKEGESVERFTVIMMTLLHMDRKDQRNERSGNGLADDGLGRRY